MPYRYIGYKISLLLVRIVTYFSMKTVSCQFKLSCYVGLEKNGTKQASFLSFSYFSSFEYAIKKTISKSKIHLVLRYTYFCYHVCINL